MTTARKPEDLTIGSVTEAIEAMQREDFLRDIRPERSARGGDENFGLWFRGHERIDYMLTPSVLRRPPGETAAYIDEVSLYRHFQTMNPDAGPRDATAFERLALMQHYQAATRLLDWTENLLVALYFAVRNPADDGVADAAVWLLNARRLNWHASATTRASLVAWPTDPDVIARSCLCRVRGRLEWHDVFARELQLVRFDRDDYRAERIAEAIAATKEAGLSADSLDDSRDRLPDLRHFAYTRNRRPETINLYETASWRTLPGIFARLRMPVAVCAPRANGRISSQSGVFTVHGGMLEPQPRKTAYASAVGLPIPIEAIESGLNKRRIAKWMLIPKDKRAGIRHTLAQIGISEASLFPELEYQSRHLISRWTYRRADRDEAE
ncbi:MAG: FRG domain-containing protein [Opitutaceae bacterium]